MDTIFGQTSEILAFILLLIIILFYLLLLFISTGYIFGFFKKKYAPNDLKRYLKIIGIICFVCWFLISFIVIFLNPDEELELSWIGKFFIVLVMSIPGSLLIYYFAFYVSHHVIKYFNKEGNVGICDLCEKQKDDIEMGTYYYGTKSETHGPIVGDRQVVDYKYEIKGSRLLKFCKKCSITSYDIFLFLSPYIFIFIIAIGLIIAPNYEVNDLLSILLLISLIAFMIFAFFVSPYKFVDRLNRKGFIILEDILLKKDGYNYIITESEYKKKFNLSKTRRKKMDDITSDLINRMSSGEMHSEISDAVQAANYKKVESLLKGGANVNWSDGFGITLLMYAAGSGHEKIVTLLLENGADKEMMDMNGQTVLDWARKKNYNKIIDIINNFKKVSNKNKGK